MNDHSKNNVNRGASCFFFAVLGLAGCASTPSFVGNEVHLMQQITPKMAVADLQLLVEKHQGHCTQVSASQTTCEMKGLNHDDPYCPITDYKIVATTVNQRVENLNVTGQAQAKCLARREREAAKNKKAQQSLSPIEDAIQDLDKTSNRQ